MAVPAIVWRGQDFHFPSERETCLPPCRLSRHGSWGSAGGGTDCEPRARDPWGAGSVLAWVLIVVSLGLLAAGLLDDRHVFRLALNPTLLGGLSLGPGEKKKVCWACLPWSFWPLSPKSAKTQAQEAGNEGSALPSHGERRDHCPWKTSCMGHASMGLGWEKGCPWPGGAPWLH